MKKKIKQLNLTKDLNIFLRFISKCKRFVIKSFEHRATINKHKSNKSYERNHTFKK